MDAVMLSRIQFAFTVGFHFLFAPITIGLAWLIVVLMSRYRRSGSALDRAIAHFWVKIFALTFAVGVATGITMEFEFGTNWAAYSRFVGDIFGAPLAAEGITSFFLESSFLAVLLLGWTRLSPRVHYISSWLVALGATLSGLWIIIANSWMQTPAGYTIVGGRAVLTDFLAAAFNPSTLPRYFHTIAAALLMGSMFMLGISAWYLLKKQHEAFARPPFTLSLSLTFVASLLVLFIGHWHAVEVAHFQPTKLAAIEGLFDTQRHAPLLVFGIPDPAQRTVHYAVRIPGGLSWLAHNDADAEVAGLDQTPAADWPPLPLTFFPFHLMVVLGCYFIGFSGLGLLLLRNGVVYRFRPYLWLALLSIPLPAIAIQLGWITAEVGRQPWIVYQLMRTAEAISVSVPAVQILISLLVFISIYSLLFIWWFLAVRREILRGPETDQPLTGPEVAA